MRSSSFIAALALILSAANASATEEDSKTFFAQGRQLRAEGNCAEAIVAFHRALDVFPQGLGSIRNIAECEEQLGQYASARNDWWSLRTAVRQSGEPKYEGWDGDAEVHYKQLASKVAKIVVKVSGAEPDKVRVTIDGKPLDPRLIGVELERDLGPHTIEAVYGGAAPITEKRTLTTGAREEVTLVIPVSSQQKDVPGPRTPPPDTGNSAMRTGGFAAIGVGAAAAVGAVISIAVERSARKTVVDACGDAGGTCYPQQKGLDVNDVRAANARMKTSAIMVDVLTGVAIVGVGVGITLVALGGSSAPAQTSAPAQPSAPKQTRRSPVELKVGVVPSTSGALLWTGGRF